MKLVMTLLVRDEEDVLELNLRHHLAAGVDEIIVTDNLSVDSTPEILQTFADTGRVRVLTESGDDYAQARWVTTMARLAAREHGADWVIHADADEFLISTLGSIRDALARTPAEVSVLAVPRLEFRPATESSLPFYERLVVRPVRAVNPRGHELRRKVVHRGHPEAELDQGNHTVRGVPGSVTEATPLVNFHYPMRTLDQFLHKVVLGGRAYERNVALTEAAREPWRTLYGLYEQGRLEDWYRERVISAAAAHELVSSGRAVIDRRMAARLRRLDLSR